MGFIGLIIAPKCAHEITLHVTNTLKSESENCGNTPQEVGLHIHTSPITFKSPNKLVSPLMYTSHA